MSPPTVRFALRLLAACAAVGLLFFTGANVAVAQQQSDELTISVIGGPQLFDNIINEGGAPGTESSLAWDPTNSGIIPAGGVVPPGGLGAGGANLISQLGGLPGINYVILTEPANEPADPNELPLPIYTGGAGGPVIVSDILVNGLNNAAFQANQFIPFIALISDNNPDLAELVNDMNNPAFLGPVVIMPETGLPQDLTPFIGQNFIPSLLPPVSVVVTSGVSTPEPSTFVLAGLGAVAMFVWRRRRAVA